MTAEQLHRLIRNLGHSIIGDHVSANDQRDAIRQFATAHNLDGYDYAILVRVVCGGESVPR